jgi:hypothetical protein
MDPGIFPNPHPRLYFLSLGTNVAAHQQRILRQAPQVAGSLHAIDVPGHNVGLRRETRRLQPVSHQERRIAAPRCLHYCSVKRIPCLVEHDGCVLPPSRVEAHQSIEIYFCVRAKAKQQDIFYSLAGVGGERLLSRTPQLICWQTRKLRWNAAMIGFFACSFAG